MSRYATWTDLVKRYSNAARASADLDMDEAYISPAEDEVDLRLSAVASVPFSAPAPGIVKSLVIDVAYFKLSIRSEETERLGEYLYGSDGKGGIFGLILSGAVKIDPTLATPNAASVDRDYHTRFGNDDPVNWRVDSDALADDAEAREDD